MVLIKNILVLSFVTVLSCSAISQTADYYTLPHGQTITIDEWSECRNITNNSGTAIFVPTKTSGEWSSFRNNLPSGVSENACSFSCGSVLVDSRDGQPYNTIQIGSNCWMAENLNFGSMIDVNINASNNGIVEKYCYDNNSNNCNSYGGLYQWHEMMAYSTSVGTQGICPTGWHIPTNAEWADLECNSDSQFPCGSSEWTYTGLNCKGYDVSEQLREGGGGFELKLSGFRKTDKKFYYGGGANNSGGYYWISERYPNNSNGRYRLYDNFQCDCQTENLPYCNVNKRKNYYLSTSSGMSVRCVLDY